MMRREALLTVAGVLLLGGCSSITLEERMAAVKNEPPAYQDGYADGCYTVYEEFRRDSRRYDSDRQYSEGWSDGKAVCSGD